jgi:peptidyl-prolyl cis-trans isomerase SurA
MKFLCLLSCSLCLGHAVAMAEQIVTDGIAARVDDAIITYLDREQMAAQAIDLLLRQYRTQPDVLNQRVAEVRADATEQLVERQLILAEFKTAGYNFPESVIEDTIQERTRQKFRDRVTLMQTLKEQGITYETYRQRTREEIIIEAMRRKNLSTDVLISPQRIVNFYEEHKTNYSVGDQVKLRMIVLNKPAGDTGAVKQLATEILRKLDEGATFSEMAKIHSDGNSRAAEGDWGWAERSTIRPELADVAFKLKPGQRSGVIDLDNSCWIMLVEDARPAHLKALTEVREEIERTLRQTELERMRKKWMARLKEKSFVLYF